MYCLGVIWLLKLSLRLPTCTCVIKKKWASTALADYRSLALLLASWCSNVTFRDSQQVLVTLFHRPIKVLHLGWVWWFSDYAVIRAATAKTHVARLTLLHHLMLTIERGVLVDNRGIFEIGTLYIWPKYLYLLFDFILPFSWPLSASWRVIVARYMRHRSFYSFKASSRLHIN